jgi:hypothetical protein
MDALLAPKVALCSDAKKPMQKQKRPQPPNGSERLRAALPQELLTPSNIRLPPL